LSGEDLPVQRCIHNENQSENIDGVNANIVTVIQENYRKAVSRGRTLKHERPLPKTMPRPLLIYDGRSPLFRRAVAAFTRGTDLQPVPWESRPVQAFLAAQFGDRPFAFILVEDDTVHVGSETVAAVLRRYADGRLPGLAANAYPATADPLGRLIHGREPADLDGSFDLKPAASAHLDPLRRQGTIPIGEGVDEQ
jgi:hypothetical protein